MKRILFVLAAVAASGCLYRDAAAPRYFRPASQRIGAESVPAPHESGIPLRMRRVHGTPFLRERMVWRSSEVEYGVYEGWRWSEVPTSYVERALAVALRERPGLRLTDEVTAATLRTELLAFDEELAPQHAAVVTLQLSLRDAERRRLLDRSFTARAPIAGEGAAAIAIAMGAALDEVTAGAAAAVGDALGVAAERP